MTLDRKQGAYIYVITPVARGKTGPVKIGIAQDPKARLRQLQSGSPVGLEIFASYWCPGRDRVASLEKHMHQCMAGVRLHGEWFAATPEVVAQQINLRISLILHSEVDDARIRAEIAEFCGLMDLGGGLRLPDDFFLGDAL